MSDHAKRVAAVLSRLPARPEIDAQAIEEIARVIVSAYAIGAASEAPYLRSGGSAKAQKDLKQLLRKLVETHNLINSMPTEAHDALHAEIELAQLRRDENRAAGRFRRIDEVRPAHLLTTEVHGFALAVSRAIERVADGPQPTCSPRSSRASSCSIPSRTCSPETRTIARRRGNLSGSCEASRSASIARFSSSLTHP